MVYVAHKRCDSQGFPLFVVVVESAARSNSRSVEKENIHRIFHNLTRAHDVTGRCDLRENREGFAYDGSRARSGNF